MYKRYVDPETIDRCDSSIHKIITEKEKNISSELNLKLFSLCWLNINIKKEHLLSIENRVL